MRYRIINDYVMKYEGKVYGKVAGRYIELTQTVEDLENEISDLRAALKESVAILHNIGFEGDISHITKFLK